MISRRRQLPESGLRFAATGLRLRLLLMLVVLFGSPGGAGAQEPSAVLAPAGECAKKRAIALGLIDPEFSIVGPVAALLDPIDVASPPPRTLPPPSPPLAVARPGPCDSPASGCNPGPVASGSPSPANPPILGGVRPTPSPTPNPPISGGSRPPVPGGPAP
jgi:hypothetical protein